MQRYDLAKMATRRRKGSVTLPPVEESAAGVRAYRAALRRMLKAIAKEAQAGVVERYKAEQQVGNRFGDMADESWFVGLVSLTIRLLAEVDRTVDDILRLEARRNTKGFMRAARRAIGVDLAGVIQENDMDAALRSVMLRNAGLIKNLAEDATNRVQQATLFAYTNGHSVRQLQSRLRNEFGILDRRAQLIARDQLSKASADFNRLRHQQAGITHYRWRTSADERVRERHRRLDGIVYEYDKPTGAEEGLPPGQPVACRCIAQGIVEF